MIVAIVTFGLSMGAIFPDPDSDDPESVSTSLSGLGFTFMSLAYGGSGAWLYYLFLKTGLGLSISAFIIASLAITAMLASVSAAKLETFNPFSAEL
jgi:hypothetical protein